MLPSAQSYTDSCVQEQSIASRFLSDEVPAQLDHMHQLVKHMRCYPAKQNSMQVANPSVCRSNNNNNNNDRLTAFDPGQPG